MSVITGALNSSVMDKASEKPLSDLSFNPLPGEESFKTAVLNHRLVILPFLTGAHHDTLKGLTAVLASGVSVKMQLLTEQDVRVLALDQASLYDNIELSSAVDSIWSEERLRQVASQEQSRFILTGALDLMSSGKQHRLMIQVRLYDGLKERFVVNDATTVNRCLLSQINLAMPTSRRDLASTAKASAAQMIIPIDDLNQSIDWITLYTLAATHPSALDLAAIAPSLGVPIARSIEALFAFSEGEATPHKHLQEKIEWYESVINMDATFELAYKRLGGLYKGLRDFDKSLQNYKQAFEYSRAKHKTRAQYANEIGICYALRQDFANAIQYWQKAITLSPGHLIAYINIAHAHETLGDFVQAAEAFEQAKQIAPHDPRLWTNLARIYSKLDRWQDALSAYLKQLSFNANDPWCHSNIANCYLQLGNSDKAQTHFESVLTLEPEGEAANYARLVMMQLMSDSVA